MEFYRMHRDRETERQTAERSSDRDQHEPRYGLTGWLKKVRRPVSGLCVARPARASGRTSLPAVKPPAF